MNGLETRVHWRPSTNPRRRGHRPRSTVTARCGDQGAIWPARPSGSSTWSARHRCTLGTMDLVVFPEYLLASVCRWIPIPRSCAALTARKSPSQNACIDNKIWGCFPIMEFNPDDNPYTPGLTHRRSGRDQTVLPEIPSLDPGRAVGTRQCRHSRDRGPQGRQDRADHLPRRHVPRRWRTGTAWQGQRRS